MIAFRSRCLILQAIQMHIAFKHLTYSWELWS